MARDSTEVDRAVRREHKLCNTRQAGGLGKAKQRQDVSVCAHAFLQPPYSSRVLISRPNGNQTDPPNLSAPLDANVRQPSLFPLERRANDVVGLR
jgi:hypothetical protein